MSEVEDLFEQGQKRRADGDFAGTIEVLRRVIEKKPDATNIRRAAYSQMGFAAYKLGNFKDAEQYYLDEQSLAIGLNDQIAKAKVFANLANCYIKLGEHKFALKYAQQYRTIAQEQDDPVCLGRALYILADVHYRRREDGDLQEALWYCKQALDVVGKQSNQRDTEEERGSICGTLGNVYFLLEDFDMAAKFHQQALDFAFKLCDMVAADRAFNNLKRDHLRKKEEKEREQSGKEDAEGNAKKKPTQSRTAPEGDDFIARMMMMNGRMDGQRCDDVTLHPPIFNGTKDSDTLELGDSVSNYSGSMTSGLTTSTTKKKKTVYGRLKNIIKTPGKTPGKLSRASSQISEN
ncbi:hypothetical protein L596_015478 [Steinernema carpocapsae]|nr:hypothetical protein L596_015478 [Steinernema carpocapsae]